MGPGDTIWTPPGEWHWHGAAPDRFMSHLAMWEAPAEGAETEWGQQVTDAEYLRPPVHQPRDEGVVRRRARADWPGGR